MLNDFNTKAFYNTEYNRSYVAKQWLLHSLFVLTEDHPARIKMWSCNRERWTCVTLVVYSFCWSLRWWKVCSTNFMQVSYNNLITSRQNHLSSSGRTRVYKHWLWTPEQSVASTTCSLHEQNRYNMKSFFSPASRSACQSLGWNYVPDHSPGDADDWIWVLVNVMTHVYQSHT